jgi:hypothetical protein
MRIAGQGEVRQIFKRLEATRRIEFAAQGIAAKDLRDFEVEQVRCVKRLCSR